MKSITTQIKNRLEKMQEGMSKKGQVIDTATSVVIGLLILLLVIFVVLLAVSSLNPTTFFTAGSYERNTTANIVANFTQGTDNFFVNVPTAMKILGIVLILGFLALLIAIVVRFRSASGGGGSL